MHSTVIFSFVVKFSIITFEIVISTSVKLSDISLVQKFYRKLIQAATRLYSLVWVLEGTNIPTFLRGPLTIQRGPKISQTGPKTLPTEFLLHLASQATPQDTEICPTLGPCLGNIQAKLTLLITGLKNIIFLWSQPQNAC